MSAASGARKSNKAHRGTSKVNRTRGRSPSFFDVLPDGDPCTFDIRTEIQGVLSQSVEAGGRTIRGAARQVNVWIIGPNDLHKCPGNLGQHGRSCGLRMHDILIEAIG